MSTDGDYAEMDNTTVSTSPNEEDERSEVERSHIVGLPPDSDYSDDSVEYEEHDEREYMYDDMSENEEEFNFDAYNRDQLEDSDEEPEPFPNGMLARENSNFDNLTVEQRSNAIDPLIVGAEVYTSDVLKRDLQLLLSSSLMAVPLKLKSGFTVEDLAETTMKVMKMSLELVSITLLGPERISQLPNQSKIEMAMALARAGWLIEKQSRFFPVIPESEREMVMQLIDGAEACEKFEEKKAKESQQFPSEEEEIRAFITFNMIAELLLAYQLKNQENEVQYQRLSTAFQKMVKKEEYRDVFEKYGQQLELKEDMVWNSEWFKAYVGRSTLKKFVTTGRFTEIVFMDLHTSMVSFRANSENREVRLFTNEDIEEVRRRWRGGNDRPRQQGAQQRRNRGEEANPNYRPLAASGGINLDELRNNEDDGSLIPTTSDYRRSERRRSPSPERSEMENSRNPSENTIRRQTVDPFGNQRSRPSFGVQSSSNSGRPPAAVAEYGTTESDNSDVTSDDGSYTGDDEDRKEENRRRKKEKSEKKQQKELERREKHRNFVPRENHNNRFNQPTYVQRRRSSSTSSRNSGPSSSEAPPPQREIQLQPPGPPRNVAAPQTAELHISESSYNQAAPPSQAPHRPSPHSVTVRAPQPASSQRQSNGQNSQIGRSSSRNGETLPQYQANSRNPTPPTQRQSIPENVPQPAPPPNRAPSTQNELPSNQFPTPQEEGYLGRNYVPSPPRKEAPRPSGFGQPPAPTPAAQPPHPQYQQPQPHPQFQQNYPQHQQNNRQYAPPPPQQPLPQQPPPQQHQYYQDPYQQAPLTYRQDQQTPPIHRQDPHGPPSSIRPLSSQQPQHHFPINQRQQAPTPSQHFHQYSVQQQQPYHQPAPHPSRSFYDAPRNLATPSSSSHYPDFSQRRDPVVSSMSRREIQHLGEIANQERMIKEKIIAAINLGRVWERDVTVSDWERHITLARLEAAVEGVPSYINLHAFIQDKMNDRVAICCNRNNELYYVIR